MAKHPIELMLELTNMLGSAAWLDVANKIVSQAKSESDLNSEDIDKLAEIMIMTRAKYITNEHIKSDPTLRNQLHNLKKAARLVEDPDSDALIDEVNKILKNGNDEND